MVRWGHRPRKKNIKALSRSGATNSNFTAFGNVDNLTYTYQSNSNKLTKIADATTGNADLGDFRDGTNTDDDYEYWADGSLKKDKNKKIASITYNYLKLPEVITFDDAKTITTEYDAGGTKLKKIVSGGETTDYEEDDIYVNNVLYQTSHDEGRIANGIYEYNITDHNNDLRVAFRDSLGIAVPTQSIFYDPWGLSMKGMQISSNPLNFNRYQFLNREIQVETGYIDLQNRQYNPQTGQFTSQDKITDGQEHLSLYQYGWNDPVLRSDADGLMPCCGDFANGVGTGFVDTFKSIGNAIAHPINTISTSFQNSAEALKSDPLGASLNQSIGSNPVLSSIKDAVSIGSALVSGDNNAAGKIVGGQLAQAAIALATDGAGRVTGGAGKVAQAESNVTSIVQKGRLGSSATRTQVDNITTTMESRGYTITGGGGRVAEEYLKPIGGAKKGGSYPDITATKDGRTVRVNTVDTRADGITPSTREAANATRIRQQTPGDHLILIPKR